MTHVRTLLTHGSKIFWALMAAALVFTLTGNAADAHHEPANKFAAAGSVTEDVEANGEEVVLTETMKVSSPFDLQLSATVECSILTYLRSTGSPTSRTSETSRTEGRVEMWVEIDGNPVPVQTLPTRDNGEVTFCNREYERTIVDTEGALTGDGIDEERDFIRTKNANAFNWFALNVGSEYDEPSYKGVTGNNVVVIELWARYTKQGAQPCQEVTEATTQEDCSNAYVGKRTLMAEPTNASVHEQVAPSPGAGN